MFTMSAQLLIQKLHKEVRELRGDVREMKEFLFAPLKDAEGDYKKSFVKKLFVRSQSGGPFYKFSTKKSFLTHVRGKK